MTPIVSLSDEDKKDWESCSSIEIWSIVSDFQKYHANTKNSILELNRELDIQREESNVLWWLVAEWSEIYEKKISALNNLQAAIVVPLELIDCISFVPGPIAIFSVMKKALCLSTEEIEEKYSLKEFIISIEDKIFPYIEKYEDILVRTFTPILNALRVRKKYYGNGTDVSLWIQVYESDFKVKADEKMYSVYEFARCLFLECELIQLLKGEE